MGHRGGHHMSHGLAEYKAMVEGRPRPKPTFYHERTQHEQEMYAVLHMLSSMMEDVLLGVGADPTGKFNEIAEYIEEYLVEEWK